MPPRPQQAPAQQQHRSMHLGNNSSSSNEYLDDEQEPDGGSKTPSSESDAEMFMKTSPSTSSPSISRHKKKGPMTPREKTPFQGWKKLVSGQIPVLRSDDQKDMEIEPGMLQHEMHSPTPSPTPYQLEDHQQTMDILHSFLQTMKQFDGIEKDLYESELPPITDMSKEQREQIFTEKLYLCQAKCDFFDTSDEMIELIGKKESMLLELRYTLLSTIFDHESPMISMGIYNFERFL